MGNEQSMHSGADNALLNSFGFQVLKVLDKSPAAEAGFESLFDFICGINGHQIVCIDMISLYSTKCLSYKI